MTHCDTCLSPDRQNEVVSVGKQLPYGSGKTRLRVLAVTCSVCLQELLRKKGE